MASPNAKTTEESIAAGVDTFGALNQHPCETEGKSLSFKVGVSVDRNKKCRRTMEDAHSFIYDFGGIRGQGYFAVFDGHAGKHAAEWCGEHFHEHLLESLRTSPSTPIPSLLNSTFHLVDTKLSLLAKSEKTHSGCTAVTAFLRLEDEEGNAVGEAGGVGEGVVEVVEGEVKGDSDCALRAARTDNDDNEEDSQGGNIGGAPLGRMKSRKGDDDTGSVTEKIKNLVVTKEGKEDGDAEASKSSTSALSVLTPTAEVKGPAQIKKAAKRTLYTANVGDARAVLSRGGRAVRLTYDHKGSDSQEAKRITDAGGYVMNNRVNGVLAVTRSLGDSSMKEFVVGSPYTTETTLGPDDLFLIVACDGLWDVCEDQTAVDLIKDLKDPQEASRVLLDHALNSYYCLIGTTELKEKYKSTKGNSTQASLTNMNFVGHENVSALGAVMALLYTSYIVLNAIFSTLLGKVIDADFTATGTIYNSLAEVAGIQFTVGSVIILLATLIPVGALAFNPSVLGGVNLGTQLTAPAESDSESYDERKVMDEEKEGSNDGNTTTEQQKIAA